MYFLLFVLWNSPTVLCCSCMGCKQEYFCFVLLRWEGNFANKILQQFCFANIFLNYTIIIKNNNYLKWSIILFFSSFRVWNHFRNWFKVTPTHKKSTSRTSDVVNNEEQKTLKTTQTHTFKRTQLKLTKNGNFKIIISIFSDCFCLFLFSSMSGGGK